ncbi:MAG: HARBI1 family protein, partial [Nitrososphaeraceae archaeon]
IAKENYVYNLLLNDVKFSRLTQLHPSEFVELYLLSCEQITNTIISGDYKNEYINVNKGYRTARAYNRKMLTADRLFCWLLQLAGERDEVMSLLFDVSPTTINTNFKFITKIMLDVLSNEMSWPDENERKLLYNLFPIYDKAIMIVDGTHCEIKIPLELDDEISYYSGYKHKHTQLYLIYVDAHGFFRRIEGPYEGKNVDRTIFCQSDVYKNDNSKYLSEGEIILADGGFSGDGQLLFPFKGPELKNNEYKAQMEQFNEMLTESRSLVEHAIHRLKSRASILCSRFTKDKCMQESIVIAAALLFNFSRRIRIMKQQEKRVYND